MAEIVTLTRRPSGLLSLADALLVSDGLRRGGLAVLPTETGYMLAARACDEAAVLRAFEVKRRDPAQPMHVACGSLEMARRFAVLSAAAERVMGAFTPGPVTVVAPKKEPLPDRLVTLRGTVGLRIPDCAATLQVVLALGEPI
ncbi:MAG: Sua5/YciO/YrdC/YwlC family protein, partial [Acidobacteriota bacterium]